MLFAYADVWKQCLFVLLENWRVSERNKWYKSTDVYLIMHKIEHRTLSFAHTHTRSPTLIDGCLFPFICSLSIYDMVTNVVIRWMPFLVFWDGLIEIQYIQFENQIGWFFFSLSLFLTKYGNSFFFYYFFSSLRIFRDIWLKSKNENAFFLYLIIVKSKRLRFVSWSIEI